MWAVAQRTEVNLPHGLNGIGEDDLLIRVPLLLIVPSVVNKFHLLEHSRLRMDEYEWVPPQLGANVTTHLSGLSGSQQQHFNLILRHHAVPLELVFNRIVA